MLIYGWLSIATGLALVITHGGIGWSQFGYRPHPRCRADHLADARLGLPARMSWEAKVAVVIGVLVNAYGIWAIEVLDFVSF